MLIPSDSDGRSCPLFTVLVAFLVELLEMAAICPSIDTSTRSASPLAFHGNPFSQRLSVLDHVHGLPDLIEACQAMFDGTEVRGIIGRNSSHPHRQFVKIIQELRCYLRANRDQRGLKRRHANRSGLAN